VSNINSLGGNRFLPPGTPMAHNKAVSWLIRVSFFGVLLLSLSNAGIGQERLGERYGNIYGNHRAADAEVAPEDRVDLNHATLEQLLKVPGLTKTWAGRIVRYRPYRSKQELLDRGIVPAELYERIRDLVIAHREKK
jgi:hypothetical protein